MVDNLGYGRPPLLEAPLAQPIGAIEPAPALLLPGTTTQTRRTLLSRE